LQRRLREHAAKVKALQQAGADVVIDSMRILAGILVEAADG
jgi:hypothetical protein